MSDGRTSWLRRHGLKLFGSLLIAAGFVWLLHKGALPILPGASAFSKMRWWTLPVYIGMWSTVHVIRAMRWHWLLAPIHPVPLRRIVAVAFIGFAAILLLPFRTGEVVRPVLIRKKGHLSGWAATGTVAAERVIDGLCMSVMLLVALLLSTPLDPLPTSIGALPIPASVVPRAAYSALALFAVAFSVMGIFYWRRDFARSVTERVVGIVSKRLAAWLAERVEKVASGLSFLPQWRYTVPFLLVTVCYWLLNAAASWLLCWGAGFDQITYVEACVSMGVLALGILLPNAPGFFGAFQISIYAGLAMFFPPELVVGPGAAFVLLIYLSQLAITASGAALGLYWERTSVGEALDSRAEELGDDLAG
ncbi:MAG: flippase-like domain-containing protein [Myxococcales bacterium]|nr:flippase-like domain-containing protein [Myxococcales bacterium]